MIRFILMILFTFCGAGMLSAGALAQLNGNAPILAEGQVIDGSTLLPLGALLTATSAAIGLSFWVGHFFASQKERFAALKAKFSDHAQVCREGQAQLRTVLDLQNSEIHLLREQIGKLEVKIKAVFRQLDQAAGGGA